MGTLGYADHNFLMSPILDGLQDMLKTCEDYSKTHNLVFSTNPGPSKSKTKCLAFLHKPKTLRKMMLCGDPLPWWDSGNHLGNKIVTSSDGIKQDMREKRARYVGRNAELCQEFDFAHPRTMFRINQIYHSLFTGSPLWDLFCRESEMIESSWNISFKIMFNIPRETHTYFTEVISEEPHVRTILIKRFISFTEQIQK